MLDSELIKVKGGCSCKQTKKIANATTISFHSAHQIKHIYFLLWSNETHCAKEDRLMFSLTQTAN